jgi:hypothetical protein
VTGLVVAATALIVVLLLALLVERSGDGRESAFDAAVRPRVPPPPEVPASLTAARWLVVNAGTTGGLHFRVSPVLAELVDARLRDGHGIDLSHPAAADIVGAPLWDIVRPDARAPDDRMAPGLTPAMVRAALDRLEVL